MKTDDTKLIWTLAKGGVLDYLDRIDRPKAKEAAFRYLESMFQADPIVHTEQQIVLIFRETLIGAIDAWAHKKLEPRALREFVKADIESNRRKLEARTAKIRALTDKNSKRHYDPATISLAMAFIDLAESLLDVERSVIEIVDMLEQPETLLAKYEAAYARYLG